MKSVAHWQWVDGDSTSDKGLNGGLYGTRGPSNNSLCCTIFVGWNHISRDLCKHLSHGINARRDACHTALVGDFHVGHLATPGTHSHQRILKAQNSSSHSRRILPKRMSSDHIRHHTMGRKQPHDGDVNSERRRLGYFSVSQAFELLFI